MDCVSGNPGEIDHRKGGKDRLFLKVGVLPQGNVRQPLPAWLGYPACESHALARRLRRFVTGTQASSGLNEI
jgi:hypothetical protein